ncbi:MAG: pyridoxal phosphate-dependent aminotransferase [Proteobacteria bacterium]|nr:pyridoxal phosphate-dependent aminotransferase [Pseudomonadota bacterium]MBU1585847.1 pyridoxal phosphate-dependent aminotransferase [Pseudomonadota bacterium]MBU2452458.1 pyridoxal phosphate-dependent aminotransferase [Pseudomonadota bacterium]MBU2631413.1 pyridoxal phosphate-dependent aminotransferase [Pseudomonadota bacterium]
MYKYANRIMKLLAAGSMPFPTPVSEMENLVDLSFGQVHYPVPQEAKTAAAQAIFNDFNSYSDVKGIEALNHSVTKYLYEKFGIKGQTSLITSGATGGLLLCFLLLIDRNEEILLPEPYFVGYHHLANICEAKITYYNLYPDFQINIQALEQKITHKTKAIILNSPGNPTGSVFSEEELKQVCEICKKNDVIIISDEIYSDFVYDMPHISPLTYYPNTILVSGLSKTWAMAGWRLGYVMGPKAYIEPMKALQMVTHVCAPSPLQYGGVQAIQCDMSQEISQYKYKRDMIYNGIKDKYDCKKPQGAFYIFPKVPKGYNDIQFVEHARKNGLIIFPGRLFSRKASHFRVSFGVEDTQLKEGIRILNSLH